MKNNYFIKNKNKESIEPEELFLDFMTKEENNMEIPLDDRNIKTIKKLFFLALIILVFQTAYLQIIKGRYTFGKLFPNETFQTVALKGRQNYLCLRRFEVVLQQLIFNRSKEIFKLLPIFSWLMETTTGDLSELHTSIEKRFGKKICSDYHACNNEQCPYGSSNA